jgi:ERO1-like protein alpha
MSATRRGWGLLQLHIWSGGRNERSSRSSNPHIPRPNSLLSFLQSEKELFCAINKLNQILQVNIHCDCPFWPDDSMCMMQSCSVCECDPNEVPSLWLQAEERACSASNTPSPSSPREESQSKRESLSDGSCTTATCAAEEDSRVDRGVDPSIHASLLNLKGWRGYHNPWMAEGTPEEEERIQFVNLLTNPERYTGYQGDHAHRIWRAIYSQEAFSCLGADCSLLHTAPQETRVFYRLISGMHTSISVHLTAKYPMEDRSVFGKVGGTTWGPNLAEFQRRLGGLEVKDRVENLYFAFLFVLRAVIKAGPLLERFEYVTGVDAEDASASSLIKELVSDPRIHSSCPVPFDEGRLWKGKDGERLKSELQVAFINITSVMDCVGCEKCKLWGKLQTLGLATALKILFSSPGCESSVEDVPQLHLERNEVIALINLLERFSSSLVYYRDMSDQITQLGLGSSETTLFSPKGFSFS